MATPCCLTTYIYIYIYSYKYIYSVICVCGIGSPARTQPPSSHPDPFFPFANATVRPSHAMAIRHLGSNDESSDLAPRLASPNSSVVLHGCTPTEVGQNPIGYPSLVPQVFRVLFQVIQPVLRQARRDTHKTARAAGASCARAPACAHVLARAP